MGSREDVETKVVEDNCRPETYAIAPRSSRGTML